MYENFETYWIVYITYHPDSVLTICWIIDFTAEEVFSLLNVFSGKWYFPSIKEIKNLMIMTDIQTSIKENNNFEERKRLGNKYHLSVKRINAFYKKTIKDYPVLEKLKECNISESKIEDFLLKVNGRWVSFPQFSIVNKKREIKQDIFEELKRQKYEFTNRKKTIRLWQINKEKLTEEEKIVFVILPSEKDKKERRESMVHINYRKSKDFNYNELKNLTIQCDEKLKLKSKKTETETSKIINGNAIIINNVIKEKEEKKKEHWMDWYTVPQLKGMIRRKEISLTSLTAEEEEKLLKRSIIIKGDCGKIILK